MACFLEYQEDYYGRSQVSNRRVVENVVENISKHQTLLNLQVVNFILSVMKSLRIFLHDANKICDFKRSLGFIYRTDSMQ